MTTSITLQINCFPHILKIILDELSAFQAESLLSVLGLMHRKEWQGLGTGFTNPIRDIPELGVWLSMMMTEGHQAFG